MSQADLDTILAACKPIPMIMLQCGLPRSPQERANDAWQALGERMGFDFMTVQPIEGEPMTHFTAVPSETKLQRETRENAEKLAAKEAEINTLKADIARIQDRLAELKDETITNLLTEADIQRQQ